MARRLFNGRAFSENGWPYVDQGSCTWVLIPGSDDVWLQIQNGPPLQILRAFAADFNAHVEPLRDADSACWTQDNSVATSNHPGGTSMDLNWNGPDNRTFRYGISEERAYPGDKARKLHELLEFYEDFVFCGGFWSIRDWMHFQVGGNTYDQQADRPKQNILDFIARKIRSDGYSTFKRSGGGTPSGSSAALVLSRATGLSLERATEILPTMQEGLRLAECTTPNRIAMFIAQTGHESANFNATEEYQNGPMDQERWIYKGRTWIQLTWRSAYSGFGRWCYDRGLVSDPNVFINNPKSLADLKWAGLGAAYYWVTTRRPTRKYPTLNEASDARDLNTATLIINGGTNGLADRQARYDRALAVGDELLKILDGDDELTPEQDRMMREIHGCLFNLIETQSLYGTPGEGKRWRLHELIKNMDATSHEEFVEREAARGNPAELERVVRVAAGQGRIKEQWAIDRARRVLAEIEATNPEVLKKYLAERGAA